MIGVHRGERLGSGTEGHDAREVVGPKLPERTLRGGDGASEAVRVAHAVGAVEQHDARPRLRQNARDDRAAAELRAGKSQGQQSQREAAQCQQRPMPQPLTSRGFVGDPLQEHQGRKEHPVALLALGQVDGDGDRQGQQPEQEGRRQELETHRLLIRFSLCRRVR